MKDKKFEMRAKKNKYDAFSKIFAQLPDTSQDRLIKIAHRLLKTHCLAKRESAGQKEIRQKAKCCVEK